VSLQLQFQLLVAAVWPGLVNPGIVRSLPKLENAVLLKEIADFYLANLLVTSVPPLKVSLPTIELLQY
jgi:hypothetical protein